jgi:hypothetical protein
MGIEKQNNWPDQRKFTLTLLLCFTFYITGCGSSYEEQHAKQAKEEEKHKELIRKKKARIKALFDQISKKYNSSPFPPDDWEGILFTYELQRLSHAGEGGTILFKAYLGDIEKTGQGIILETVLQRK